MSDDGGLSRIQQRMALIPKRVREAVKPALAKEAEEIVQLAKSLCPVAEVDGGTLRDSIGWTFGAAPAGSIALAHSVEGETSVTIYAGNDEAFYARWIEFGTQSGVFGQRVGDPGAGIKQHKTKGRKSYRSHPGTAAQPFFFPAYRLSKKKAQARIKAAIRKAVKETWGKK